MAEQQFLLFTCPSQECGKKFKMKRPAKGGLFNLECPHCHHKMQVKIPAPEQPAGAPASPAAQPAEARQKPDFSERQPVKLEQQFLRGNEYEVDCPHCGWKGVKFTPKNTGRQLLQCPGCKGKMDITVTEVTQIISMGGSMMQRNRGKLVLHRSFKKSLEWELRDGKQVIGRRDVDVIPDIAIDDDPYISRRSVEIDVQLTKTGYKFVVNVLKSTNPVLHNKRVMTQGFPEYLNFGDTLQIGKTLLTFEKSTLGAL